MNIPYLNSKHSNNKEISWRNITRDERTFCSYLFHVFENKPNELAQLIASCDLPEELPQKNNFNFRNTYEANGIIWELGFEVCFYRDFLLKNNIRVKGDSTKIIEELKIHNPSELIKRTFDLCIFSDKQLVIIEAKTAEGLTTKQFSEFKKDKEYLTKIFSYLDLPIPEIKLIILASSQYYKSNSFTSKRGVGKVNILDSKIDHVDHLISWKQLQNKIPENILSSYQKEMLVRADDLFL
jgi:hypothetical protein